MVTSTGTGSRNLLFFHSSEELVTSSRPPTGTEVFHLAHPFIFEERHWHIFVAHARASYFRDTRGWPAQKVSTVLSTKVQYMVCSSHIIAFSLFHSMFGKETDSRLLCVAFKARFCSTPVGSARTHPTHVLQNRSYTLFLTTTHTQYTKN